MDVPDAKTWSTLRCRPERIETTTTTTTEPMQESPVVVNNNNNGDTSNSSNSSSNIFKQCHNHHKRHPHNPDRLDDLDELLDFRRCDSNNDDPQNNNNNKFAPYIRRIDVVDRRAVNESGHTTAAAAAVDAVYDEEEEEGRTMAPREQQQRPGEDFGRRCFGLSCHAGFLFFPAALDDDVIRRLAYCALTEYCEAPYRTNIELIAPKSSEIPTENDVTTAIITDATISAASSSTSSRSNNSMWDLWVVQQQEEKEEQQKLLAMADERTTTTTSFATKHRPPPPRPPPRYYRCLEKLSWATLGYFYDWTNRCYHEDDHHHHHSGQQWQQRPSSSLLLLLPPELVALSRVFANISLGLEQANYHNNNHRELAAAAVTTSGCHYNPSACIVNYYGEKGVMGGHRDELELALDKPIVSISLGRPAVFLLGGKTLEHGPIVPMIVRSGDVLVLGGDARLNYHSMARLLPSTLPCPPMMEGPSGSSSSRVPLLLFKELGCWDDRPPLTPRDEMLVDRYLATHRININIRQVYN